MPRRAGAYHKTRILPFLLFLLSATNAVGIKKTVDGHAGNNLSCFRVDFE